MKKVKKLLSVLILGALIVSILSPFVGIFVSAHDIDTTEIGNIEITEGPEPTVTPQINPGEIIELFEDTSRIIDLRTYFIPGWDTVFTYGGQNLNPVIYNNMLSISPVENWFGSEQITIHVGYYQCLIDPNPYEFPVYVDLIFNNQMPPTYWASIDLFFWVIPVNDPPQMISEPPQFLMVTGGEIENSFDLDDIFYDMDSDLVYSWESFSGAVRIERDENNLITLTADPINFAGASAIDIITFSAYDGEYTTTSDVYVTIIDPISLELEEDTVKNVDLLIYLTEDINSDWNLIKTESPHTLNVDYQDFMITVTPESNWNGQGYMEVLLSSPTTNMIYQFGYDVNVLSVNDPPEIITQPQNVYVCFERTMENVFDLDDLFLDVDSDMMYSWSSVEGNVMVSVDEYNYITLMDNAYPGATDTIRLTASDGEFTTVCEIPVEIVTSETLNFYEDNIKVFNLDSYMPGWEFISCTNTDELQIEIINNSAIISPLPNYAGNAEIDFIIGQNPTFTIFENIYHLVFAVEVVQVNDPPEVISSPPQFLMVTDSRIENCFDLDDIFYDMDSDLEYSWEPYSGVVCVDIDENNLVTLNTIPVNFGGISAIDIIKLHAFDGEYTVSCDIYITIIDPIQIEFDEDMVEDIELSSYISENYHDWNLLKLDAPNQLNVDFQDKMITVTPENNWNGQGYMEVLLSSPSANLIYQFGYDVNVLPVNDPPQIISVPPIFLMFSDGEIENSFDLDDIFNDVDSDLVYSWESFSGGVDTRMDENHLITLTADPINFAGVTAVDIITFYANDGEYTTSCEVFVTIIDFISLEFDEDTVKNIDLSSYLPEDDQTGWSLVKMNSENTLNADYQDNTITITPDDNWYGQGYMDIILSSRSANLMYHFGYNVNVLSVNDPPSTIGGSAFHMTLEDTALEINIADYFTDIDSKLTCSFDTNEYFSFDFDQTDGSIMISPKADWNGEGTIDLTATDGEYQITQSIEITVLPVNDAPTILQSMNALSFNEDTSTIVDINAMFSDVDSELQYSVSTDESNFHLVIDANNLLSISTNTDWHGSGIVRIMATDGENTMSQDLTVQVEGVNDAPVLEKTNVPISYSEDSSTVLLLSELFSDIDSELVYTVETVGKISYEIDEAQGILILTSEENWYGIASVKISASDGEYEVTQTVNVCVTSVNDAPYQTKTLPTLVVDRNGEFVLDLQEYFDDVDGDALTYQIVGDDNVLIGKTQSEGLYTFSASESIHTSETLTIIISDGTESIEVTMQVDVIPVQTETSISTGTSFTDAMLIGGFALASICVMALAFITRQRFGKHKTTGDRVA